MALTGEVPTQPVGPIQVSPDDIRLYNIDCEVVAVTPALFETGSADEFHKFLIEGGKPFTYLWYDDVGNEVGYLALVDLDDSEAVEARGVIVRPDYQRSGFGRTMMEYAEYIAMENNKNKVTLVTHPDNTEALEFYKDLGYKIVETVDDHYGDGAPRYVLEKTLETNV